MIVWNGCLNLMDINVLGSVMRRLEVEFYDSNFMHGWEGEGAGDGAIDDLALATTMGYFKSEDENQITLTMAYSDYGLRFAKLTIPKGSIKSIKELRVK